MSLYTDNTKEVSSLLDYIRLDSKSAILSQIPKYFNSAAILLHPFVRMPSGWTKSKKNHHPYKHIYPTDEEILNQAKPVLWKTVMDKCGLTSFEEVKMALMTSIGALNEDYARSDLADLLNTNLKQDIYYPTEDKTSVLLLKGILEVLGSKGADSLHYSEPILDNSGSLNLKEVKPLKIYELSSAELIVTNENMDYAFMSIYDSFNTLFLSQQENVKEIVQKMKWEAIICDNNTYMGWFLSKKH
jgi:hypothetical protein